MLNQGSDLETLIYGYPLGIDEKIMYAQDLWQDVSGLNELYQTDFFFIYMTKHPNDHCTPMSHYLFFCFPFFVTKLFLIYCFRT